MLVKLTSLLKNMQKSATFAIIGISAVVLALLPGLIAIPANPTGYYSRLALAQEATDPQAPGESQSCTERMGLSSGWIVCGILEAVSDGIGALFDIADSLLNIDGQNLYESDELRAIWSYFRVVATFALVIIGLVMVISQALGGGL